MFERDRFDRPREVWLNSKAPREFVYSALASGELRAIRRGRRYLIPGHAALEWLDRVGR